MIDCVWWKVRRYVCVDAKTYLIMISCSPFTIYWQDWPTERTKFLICFDYKVNIKREFLWVVNSNQITIWVWIYAFVTCDVGSGITTTVSTFKSLIGRNKFFDDDNFGKFWVAKGSSTNCVIKWGCKEWITRNVKLSRKLFLKCGAKYRQIVNSELIGGTIMDIFKYIEIFSDSKAFLAFSILVSL